MCDAGMSVDREGTADGSDYELPEGLLARLEPVRSIGAVTGAGVSAESGIRTYRGKGGLYDDPEGGDRTVQALSRDALLSDPHRTWRVIGELARPSRGAQPNPAHYALVEIERVAERFVLLTQNVDGLHQRAGSENVIDVHGTVFNTICTVCAQKGRLDSLADVTCAPPCPHCGELLRPDVVLFGEPLKESTVERFYRELCAEPPDLLLVIGTTAEFSYIADPVKLARDAGKLTVEVNPERTVLSDIVDYSLRASASRVVPALAAAIKARLEQTDRSPNPRPSAG